MPDVTQPHANVAMTGDTMFDGYLEPVLAQDYFAEVEATSIVQRLARKIPMGPTGVRIPHWEGSVSAGWVAEGGQKPITKGDMSKQDVVPHKIATIFVESAEVVRANPANYLGTMRTKVATAIAVAFDRAVLHGVDTPFSSSVADTAQAVDFEADPYDALNAGLTTLIAAGRKWTGTLLAPKTEPIVNGAKDGNGRPLFLEIAPPALTNIVTREGTVLGRPTVIHDHAGDATDADLLGVMGDFSQIIWGQVGGLTYDVSDNASLDISVAQDGSQIVSLWQNNLVAVRVEAEFGVLINDVNAFVKLNESA